MSWWVQYQKGSVGNILHFLYHVCNYDVANECMIGQSTVTYWGKPIATFSYNSEGFPVFAFNAFPNDRYLQGRIDFWTREMSENHAKAIADWQAFHQKG